MDNETLDNILKIIALAGGFLGVVFLVIRILIKIIIDKRDEDIKKIVDSFEKASASIGDLGNKLERLMAQFETTDERSRDAMSLARINKETLMENTAMIKRNVVEIQNLRDWKHGTANVIQNLVAANELNKLANSKQG